MRRMIILTGLLTGLLLVVTAATDSALAHGTISAFSAGR